MRAEPQRLNFAQIRDKVEHSYPNPISTAFRRYCQTSTDQLTDRHKLLLDLFELLVKFLCAIQLSEGRDSVPNFTQLLPARSQSLDFLEKAGAGQWMRLLRELCQLDLKGPKPFWSQKISDWYHHERNVDSDLAVNLLKQHVNLAGKSSHPPISVILNSFTNPRNDFAHLPLGSDPKRNELVPTLESVLAYVFESASVLSEMRLFAVKEAKRTEDGQNRMEAHLLKGLDDEIRQFTHENVFEPNWVYLTNSLDGQTIGSVTRLTPFLLWQPENSRSRAQMFVLTKATKNKISYASFLTGDTHEEPNARLLSVLTDLTSHDLRPDFDEHEYHGLRPEVRSEIAQTQYSQALRLVELKYFEQALKFLRDANSSEKRPDILLSTAKVMIELKESPEEISEILQQCLNLDPTNAEAQHLLAEVAENKLFEPRQQKQWSPELPLRKTVFHLFSPRRLKNHAITFWSVIIVGWYSTSALLEFSTGSPERAVATTLAMLCCLAVVFGAALLRPWAERLRTPLKLQLDRMKEQRFNEWFDEQLRMLFEPFSFHDQRPRVKRNRTILYVIGLAWMIAMVGGAMFFSEAYHARTLLMIKRLLDYTVLFAVLFPAAQYTIAITLFVYRFSNLALKPTLTRMTNDGVRHLGPFVAFNIVFGTLIYSLIHLSFAIGFTNPFRVDLLFLFVGTGITAVWTVAFPFQLRKSLQASKNIAIVKYSHHVEEAFNKFMEDPNRSNEDNYKRLLDNEKIIQKISIWPLSVTESIFIIGGSNMLLALVASAYVLYRLGWWSGLFDRF